VVAHAISYEELDFRGLTRRMAAGGFHPDRANQVGVDELRDLSPDDLLALLRRHLTPRGLTAWFGGMIALTDCLIHHQDIRRALGRPRAVPADRLRPVLRAALAAPQVGGAWRTRGLRLVATDLPWSAGFGLEVAGPAESVLMAIAGRRGVTGELSGPGAPTLTARIGG
jgi:uncharacterized protein (TIGR03083 family)